MKEIWKKIEGFENYQISNFGNVKNKNNKILKPQKNIYGYMTILLYNHSKVKNYRIHRLVLENFNPIEGMETLQVNHINQKRDDNRLENLEWCTPKENCNRKSSKDIFYNSIGCYDELGNYFNSYREAGKFYKISPNTVKRDCLGITKRVENKYEKRNSTRMTFHK